MVANRIRDLREARGLSLHALARLVGTTASQIGRLERGERKLTIEWIERIAPGLSVNPLELLHNVTTAHARLGDVRESVPPRDAAGIALARSQIRLFSVEQDSVEDAGVAPGSLIAVDCKPEAIANIPEGAVVVAEAQETEESLPVLLLRQFVRPATLMTNRRGGANVIIRLDNHGFASLKIIGVQVAE